MRRVEETPKATQPKHLSSFPIKWKTVLAALLIGLVVLAGASIIQYQALNGISEENAQLEKVVELVQKGALYQSEYDIKYGIDFFTIFGTTRNPPDYDKHYQVCSLEPWFCIVYSLHDNCTLNISLSSLITSDPPNLSYEPSPLHMPTVQSGNVFDLRTNETAPMIWSTNETAMTTYSISLPSMGWYTISLQGPLMYNEEEEQVRQDLKLRNLTEDSSFELFYLTKNWGEGLAWSYFDYWSFVVCWSASLTMTYEGMASPFIITISALEGS